MGYQSYFGEDSSDRLITVHRHRHRVAAAGDVAAPGAEGDRFAAPQLVFEGPKIDIPGRGHDISLDGERILLVLGPPEDSVAYLNVVTNWFEELRRLAPARQ